jgi:hypothetical protein
MPSPKSPITVLADALNAMPALQGFARVLAGKNALPLSGAPPRIVLFPVEGGYDSPEDNVASLVDVDLKIAAHLWAHDLDEAWDLRQRYIQALKQQAIGNPSQPMQATDAQAGIYYEFLTEAWDIKPDTAQQGQELEVIVAGRFAGAPQLQLGTGEIAATALHGTQTALTAPLAASDTTASVTSTAGFASSGSLSIDREQLTYTGITPTSFTGLSRGVNHTTPAAHASTAPVTQ